MISQPLPIYQILRTVNKSIVRNWGRKAVRKLRGRRDESLKLAVGHLEAGLLRLKPINCLKDAEFKVFSQWGEDGIIQYLVDNLNFAKKSFIEFGVQDYSESNTRFLLMNNNWSGMIIDGADEHRKFLRRQSLDWMYDIQAVQAFITAENINALIHDAGMDGDLGILSVDIDGVDYWVLRAITSVKPKIVIVEYNAFFGNSHPVSVPYRSDFSRYHAHFSHFLWGASLPAFHHLLSSRNYAFVGCNSAGNNAFFVNREGGLGEIDEVSLEDGYTDAKFWDYRTKAGEFDLSRNRSSLLCK